MAPQLGQQPNTSTVSETAQYQLRGLPVLVKELLAGGVAGGLSKTSVAPLERVKILFQTGQMRGTGVGSTLLHIYQGEGLIGFFKGNGASVLRIVPYAALNFTAYEHIREVLVDRLLPAESNSHPSSLRVPPWLDLVAGSAAGAASTCATYPLDFVRTRLAFQTQDRSQLHQQRQQLSQERSGLRSPPAQQPQARVSTSQTAYMPAASRHASHATVLASATQQAASSHASAAASVAQPAPQQLPRSIRAMLVSTVQREGVLGLYRGLGPTLAGILPYAGLKFYVYQSLKQQYARWHMAGESSHSSLHRDAEGPDFRSREEQHSPHKLPVLVSMSFGAVAGLAAQTVTFPLDVVRRQMQVQGLRQQESSQGRPVLKSTIHGLASIVKQHGWTGLFRGLSINYMKVVPTTAIGFAVYDGMKGYLDLPRHM
ncbi:hypothetical protein WJX84_004316 [Apatococcus fuscideae]|uniref:Mitochondrial carrier protein n=1 Tax=Apatococcus fuscideae TaxID=2026836 RepID=A0AAW1TJW2_9CHLO